MKPPWEAGRVLTPKEFKGYLKQVMFDFRHCTIRPNEYGPFLDFAILLKPGEWPKLARLTEKLSQEVAAAGRELVRRPELYDSLGLRADIAEVLKACAPNCRPSGFAQVMRFDFCFTQEGWRFTEGNPDGPSGYIEAEGLTRGMEVYYPGFSAPPNPAAAYAAAIHRFGGNGAQVAFFHRATRLDRLSPQYVLREVENRGMRGVLANPRQVKWKSNFAQVWTPTGNVRPDLLIRMVMSDWLPNLRHRDLWVPWFCGSKTPMSNPGSSIVVESKRLPILYKELDAPMSECRAYSPESRSPDEVPRRSQNQWVFKPAIGGGGRVIGIAGAMKKLAFEKIADEARRNAVKWVAQRRFEYVPVPTERGPGHVCLGIYTVDGVATGIHARIRGKPLIDPLSMIIPILIPRADLESRLAVSESGS